MKKVEVLGQKEREDLFEKGLIVTEKLLNEKDVQKISKIENNISTTSNQPGSM